MRRRRTALIVLHDGGLSGATAAAVRATVGYGVRGWDTAYWFPSAGAAVEAAGEGVTVSVRPRPIRYSARGMREEPGMLRRLAGIPGYLLAFAVRLVRDRPDVVHCNTYYTLPEATIARLLGLPVVLHAHEILGPRRKDRVILGWTRLVASRVVAVSQATADRIAASPVRARTVIVRNGVSVSEPPREASEPPIVGTVGTISRRKGTDLFLDLAERVARVRPDVRFRVLGPDGPGSDAEFAAAIRRRLTLMDGRPSVSVAYVADPHPEVAAWSVFVLPAREDPFPLAVLEALALGIPVVATSVGGIPEQVEDGHTGLLVPPDDATALADAVLTLLSDRDRRAAMAQTAREEARIRFSLARQSDCMVDVYESVLR